MWAGQKIPENRFDAKALGLGAQREESSFPTMSSASCSLAGAGVRPAVSVCKSPGRVDDSKETGLNSRSFDPWSLVGPPRVVDFLAFNLKVNPSLHQHIEKLSQH